MTGEEMERAIEFLLKSQAGFETQLAQTNKQLEMFAQFTRSNLEAQRELNQSLRETVRSLTISQARTDERLSDLEHKDGNP
jgi:hypothetical protein